MSEFYAGLDLGQAGDYTALAILERVTVKVGEPRVERIEYPPEIPEALKRIGLMGPLQRALSGVDDTEYQAVHGISPFLAAQLPTIVEERIVQDTAAEYHLRHLERPELGIPYPQIVAHVLGLLETPQLRGKVTLLLDRTGVGRAVYDLFAQGRTSAQIIPISITGGNTVARDEDGSGGYRVPKRDLVGVLQVLLQSGRLRIAEGLPLGQTLAAEMLNFKATISASGHDSYAAGSADGGMWREGAHDDLVLAVTLPCWYVESVGQQWTFADGRALLDWLGHTIW